MNDMLAVGAALVLCALVCVFARLTETAFGFRRLGVAAAIVQILAVLLAVSSVILALFPAMPCEPVRISLGRRSSAAVTVDTLNFALPYLSSLALTSLSAAGFCLYLLTPAYRKDMADRREKRHHCNGRKRRGRAKGAEIPDIPRNTSRSVGQKLLLMAVSLLFLVVFVLVIHEMTTL